MSQEILNTILSGLAAFGGIAATLVGGVTIWLAIRHNRQRRRERQEDRRLAEEQLALARQEALRHPDLKVVDISLVNAEKVEDVVRTREAQEKWPAALEKAKKEEENRQQTLGFYLGAWVRALKEMGDYSIQQAEYEGPCPDLVMSFELRNLGHRPAKDVEGGVKFDSNVLEPITFPKMNGKVSRGLELDLALGLTSEKDASLKVGTVPPYPSGKTFVFRIALPKKSSGNTTAVAVFSTPDGDYLEERIPLEVP